MFSDSNKFNLDFTKSVKEVDQINKKFYGRFNYPWPPRRFPKYPKDGAAKFLAQDIGDWKRERLPKKPVIWVAGCGTNQAIFTALKYPEAEVIGTDISTQSIEVCKKNARSMGIDNLTIEEKSLNDVTYSNYFDYIICTGVIHHNSNPQGTLEKISKGLKTNGIMELMVYNYYHRLLTTACQKAVRTFYKHSGSINTEFELSTIHELIKGFKKKNMMHSFLQSYIEAPEAKMADALLQPVEYSYTIQTLHKMITHCNLEYTLHTLNQFDIDKSSINWNLTFSEPSLSAKYDALEDVERWQISNLLLLNESPMLWFYLQRKDSEFKISEKKVCDQFLDTKFKKNSFEMQNYVINVDGDYELQEQPWNFPNLEGPADLLARRVWEKTTADLTMREVLEQLEMKLSFQGINNLRIRLTTLQFPYLLAETQD